MTSNQASAPGSKASKFALANPLAPMVDPFAGLDQDEREAQQVEADRYEERLQKAMEELKEKHRTGTNEVDDPDRAPTGEPYQIIRAQAAKRERERQLAANHAREQEAHNMRQAKEQARALFSRGGEHKNNNNSNSNNYDDESDSDDDDDDYLLDEDGDPELEAIRQRRIQEMKAAQVKHAENVSKGHGQYRTIGQDDFLSECTGTSEFVAVHFFHDQFQRCKQLDHHLHIIAPLHTTCKFLRINAEKAPFFVAKLKIQTLPTLIVFQDGKAVNRLTGFEGLARDPSEPDKWHTGRLQEWLAQAGAIEYTVPTEEVRDEMRRLGLQPRGAVWSGGQNGYVEDGF